MSQATPPFPPETQPNGQLTVICGPMFAGKTTELLKRVLWAKNGLNAPVAVFKAAYDSRYSAVEIASHDGLVAAAAVISDWPYADGALPDAQHIFFDEIQFFTAPHFSGDIVAIIRNLLAHGRHVTVGGLDADWRGDAFAPTATLMAMADDVLKLRAHCAVCGRPAGKTHKRLSSAAASDDTIQLGGAELYEPRCRQHWSLEDTAPATLFTKAST